MGAVLGHDHGDDPLGGALREQRPGDLLDHAGLGALAEPDQDGAVADRLHVAALQRGAAEVVGVEPPVVAELRVPVLEVGLGEHRVVAVDGGDVVAPRAAGPARTSG